MNDIEKIRARYNEIAESAQCELDKVQSAIYTTGTLRLLLFVAGVAALVVFRAEPWYMLLAILLAALIPFLLLVKYHDRLFYRKEYLSARVEVNRQELAALDYDFSSFDDGGDYADTAHLYSYDLDLFGPGSLFQCINRTSTGPGRTRLASWLSSHLLERDAIMRRQEAVAELSSDLEFRQHFRILGLLHKGGVADEAELNEWGTAPSLFRGKKYLRILPFFVASVNVVLIVLALAGTITAVEWGAVFALFMICSFVLSGKITRMQAVYGSRLKILKTYAELLSVIEKRNMKAPLLKAIADDTGENGEGSSHAIRRLSRLMNELDWRNNIFVYAVLNGLFFWELWQVMRIEDWRMRHAADMPRWLNAIGVTDALLSLATFSYNNPDYVFPSVPENGGGEENGAAVCKSFCLCAENMGHPLIERSRCVRNGIDMKGAPAFMVITGANMAGKSTYLRTVGVNCLLACVGAPVCATKMTFSPVRIVTSLRTSDSLNNNESYFFAELKRLKMIIGLLQRGEKLFIILDEILKGTNSADKQKGSAALVRQFMSMNADGIIATHDLMLGSLAELYPEQIRNYCFESDIKGGELTFSYKLRTGIARNMNACFLMKKMGIAVID